jgi:LmbE family N-acetylglucosaminyl deacetylase
MRILSLHAHFDDFEFVAAGTFEMLRRHHAGKEFRAKVVVCTDGKAGHHFHSREETGWLRLREQEASARIGGYEFSLLRYPNGEVPREACLEVNPPLLAGMWKIIRDFEPDYIFCPPVPVDPLAGIHVDHVAVAEAVRKVAYMINVPHAFTPEYPGDESQPKSCKVPVILNVFDAYMGGANAYDFAVDVEAAFDRICEMTWCHQSQITEWIPWVGRHKMAPPASFENWREMLRCRMERQRRSLGIGLARALEFFTVTAWGENASLAQLKNDFPTLVPEASHLETLEKRLNQWREP